MSFAVYFSSMLLGFESGQLVSAARQVVIGDGREIGELDAKQSRTVRRKSFSSKEKQIWAIRGKKIKAKRKNRKRPSLV